MKTGLTAAAVCLAAGLTAGSAQAALLGSYTADYGTDTMSPTPSWVDVAKPTYFTESDNTSHPRYNESFDFSGLAYDDISHFDFTLRYRNTDDWNYLLGFIPIAEDWKIRIQGQDSGASSDDYFGDITRVGDWTEQSWTLDASTSGGGSAWTNALLSGAFDVWLADEAWGRNAIDLDYAQLDVYGTASVVPLPAAAWFMLTALGGLVGSRWATGRKDRAAA